MKVRNSWIASGVEPSLGNMLGISEKSPGSKIGGSRRRRGRSLLGRLLVGGGISAACGFFPAFPALAKPQPPVVLQGIYDDFQRLEEDLNDRNWKRSVEGANTLKQVFVLMVPDIKKYSPSESVSVFAEVIARFFQDLEAKDLSRSQISFSMLQGIFVKTMGIYEYPVPPLVTCLEKNINEAAEKFKEKSFDAVAWEMQELIVLLSQAEGDFRNKGIESKEISSFKVLLINTKMASAVRDSVQTQEGLDAIQRKYQLFRARF